MSTDLEKPKNLEDIVRDKIRTVFAEMIPDSALDSLIEKEWKRFSLSRIDDYGRKHESDLTIAIRESLKDVVSKELVPRINIRIGEIFNTSADFTSWDKVADDALKDLIVSSGKSLLEIMMVNMVRDVTQNISSALYAIKNHQSW